MYSDDNIMVLIPDIDTMDQIKTSKHDKGILTQIRLEQLRTADDLDLHHTLDGDVNRLVHSRDIGTFAMRILQVADGNKLPAATGPLSGVHPLAGHVEPVGRPTRKERRDEGLEFLWAVILDVDEVADVRLEGRMR